MTENMKQTAACVGIALVTLIAYWNVQYNQLISYDDVKYLIENEMVRGGLSFTSIRWALTAVYDANWFPLTWLMHLLNVSFFGIDAKGHHFVNLAFHISNSLLLYILLHNLTGKRTRSFVVALFFSVHPLHVESVVWAAELKDVFSTFFFMLTLYAYCVFLKSRTVLRYMATCFLFACGLMSKPMLVSLPLLFLCVDFWPLQRMAPLDFREKTGFTQLLIEKIPLFLLAAISSYITFMVQNTGGAVSDTHATPFDDTFFHITGNYLTYIFKLLWPLKLSVFYPYQEILSSWEAWGGAVVVSGITFVAVYFRIRFPFLLSGWLWFLCSLIPVIGVVAVGAHSVADRYTYIPSIGFIVALVWLWCELIDTRWRFFSCIVAVALLAALTIKTWYQVQMWKDGKTLFEHALSVTENNWLAHANLASELLKYNKYNEAIVHLYEAVRINPKDAVTHYNLAMTLNTLGDTTGAIDALNKAILLKPELDKAYFYAALFNAQSGNMVEAYSLTERLKIVNAELAAALARNLQLMNSGR